MEDVKLKGNERIKQKTLEATGQKTYSDELLFDYFVSKYSK